MIRVQNLVGGYAHSPIIKGLDLEVKKGEFFALLGPNGSGKTTLFKLITGQLPIKSGKVSICGKEISTLSKLDKAKKMAVLTQEVQVSFDYTVEEIISLGRYPHQKGILKQLSKKDRKVIEEVMEITQISEFRKTQFRLISGGEKQRVLLAKALAQEPEILLLDEPTNHLDIKHTFQMLNLLKERQQTTGLTIFAILHDLNVASLYADTVALLHNGKFLEVGDVDILRKEDQLKKVYEVKVKSQSHPTVPKPQLLMTPNHFSSSRLFNFEDSYKIKQSDDYLHVQFDQPLRTISNTAVGAGIQWVKYFCQFQGPHSDILQLMEKYSMPHEQSAGIMTAVKLEDMAMVTKEIEGIHMMIIVTEGTGKTINIMLFIDAHFTDGALVDGYMSAVEAKVKAIHDLRFSQMSGNVASSDTMLLAFTQQGEKIASAGSGTVVGKAIGQMVYGSIKESFCKYLEKVH
ncbi:ATP-binding cassette domain-containing protein [Bacillus sp. EB106-08-02-XG196]|uniref:ATP-binding cassette domain-containing protein n=1 Tax=Bacillus sp. EB106-08-02-XG196 TaxID=2737049 RepID=UPI0015C417BF|nr:ATP-binding cassette domain-containing protein [Bacillus sp. EB106-08-02-XG196]NWQ43570.1 ATP-binding cassette domain-containing protein [Bacillus sp. EB106-08-02-XG196]